METIHLVMLPLAIGMLPISVFLWLSTAGYRDTKLQYLLIGLTFFIWGFMGLPMIRRREMPWLIRIRGWLAVAEGVLLLVIWWEVAIVFIGLMLRAR